MARCPRCGTPADAVAVVHHLPRGQARRLAQLLDVVRRELGLPSVGDALVEAARRVALDLNQRAGVVSGHAGHEAPPTRRTTVGEHEQEQKQEGQAEGQPGETGAPDAGTTVNAGDGADVEVNQEQQPGEEQPEQAQPEGQ